MNITTNHEAATKARELIAAEVSIQNKMWGDANERADAMKGQLLGAACAQATAIFYEQFRKGTAPRTLNFDHAQSMFYPTGWSGFRDYGSDIANLVVAAAYLESEIKRRLLKGESFERSKRETPYTGDQPAMSSQDAA